MKKTNGFLALMLMVVVTFFTSCKLPWASVDGTTVVDYLPIIFIIYGVLALIYTAIKYAKASNVNGKKQDIGFIGWSGIVSIIFGAIWIISA